MGRIREILRPVTTNPSPSVWPDLRCKNAKGLIEFLATAFGFEVAVVVEEGGIVHHAELRWSGCGGVMLGDVSAHPDDELHMQLPAGPVMLAVVCDDPDALFERATKLGVEVLQPVKDKEYGSRDFVVRDPEGNVWTFGTAAGA